MEKNVIHPQKVLDQIFSFHYPKDDTYQNKKSFYVIVVNAESNMPQYFNLDVGLNSGHGKGGLGCFLDAYPLNSETETMPASIYDLDSAQYLIGQDAIYRSMCPDLYKDDAQTAPIYRLIPVFGAMIPDCLPQNLAK